MAQRLARPLRGAGSWFVVTSVIFVFFAARIASAGTHSHTFEFDSHVLNGEKPRSVAVAGSFNGWSKDATPMSDPDHDGIYTAKVDLNEGVAYYKFVVNGDRWFNDPKSDKELETDDNYGGRNSAVLIGTDIRKAPPAQPNHINAELLRHDPADDADASGDSTLRVRVRAQAGDVEHVSVVVASKSYDLSRIGTADGFDTFGGTVDGNYSAGYYFLLEDGTARALLDKNGAFEGRTADDKEKNNGEFPAPHPRIQTPGWAKDAVWYQIFPERFRNGDPSNDPGDKEYEHLVKWTSDWWKAQPGEAPGDENFYKGVGNVWKRRYGGDIQGIKWSLPYLRSLGVTAIYLNPIFEADSMHKYDTSDYRHVDDNFGVKGDLPIAGETDDPATWKWSKSDRVFLDFVAEAHRQGFKVICDGVFNHVGRSHPFFQDIVKHGKASKYVNWFEIESFPNELPAKESEFGKPGGLNFKAWDGPSGHLPILRKDPNLGLAHGPREHVLAIVKRWLAPDGDPSKGIDGWRLDVPGDIPHPFWVDFRKTVKTAKPDAYISGEIWDWAQAWLQGDQFDAVMNYRFAVACQDFFVNQSKAITPSQFDQRLNQMIYAYPLQVALDQMNLFDSHDTDRFASMFVNPDLAYDASNRIQDNGPSYKPDKPTLQEWTRFEQAARFQMSFVGAPMIYYGDEAGMWSPDDPSNRQPMVWKDLDPYENPQVKFDEGVFDAYRRAIAARATLPALRTGFYHAVKIDDAHGVLAFVRNLDGRQVFVLINRSNQPAEVSLDLGPVMQGKRLVDWLDPRQADLIANDGDSLARPTLQPKAGAGVEISARNMSFKVPAYGTVVLSDVQ